MALPNKEARNITETQFLSSDHINGFLVFIRKFIADQNIQINALYNLDGAPCLLYNKFRKVNHGCKFFMTDHALAVIGSRQLLDFRLFQKVVSHCMTALITQKKNVKHKECSTSWPGSTIHIQKIISSLVRPRQSNIPIILMPCSKQANGYDCGPYALANATALVMGLNPSNLEFSSDAIRNHTKKCSHKW